MIISRNVPMKDHTSFRAGGNAAHFYEPESVKELVELLSALSKEGREPYFLGNGTNILVSDEGVGEVVSLRNPALNTDILRIPDQRDAGECRIQEPGGVTQSDQSSPEPDDSEKEGTAGIRRLSETSFRAGAGTLLGVAAGYALSLGLGGMEALQGIPGTVGGAVTMNAGAYGTEIRDVLDSALVLSPDGHCLRLSPEELSLSYRHSVVPEKQYLVLSADLSLKKADPAEIRSRIAEYQRCRAEKQPLNKPSAGSAFRRPEGHFAGKLIEDAGLKGFRIGDAQVSEKHCGFIVNLGNASASELYELFQEVIRRVYQSSGIRLVPEVKFWGRFQEQGEGFLRRVHGRASDCDRNERCGQDSCAEIAGGHGILLR